ncbi:hypothetical protein [Tissierella simiarum]|nr:hypothetical protein [Tissierella simiarum]
MQSNIGRIIKDIEMVTNFNKISGYGCTRFSYSEEDKLAKN